MSEEDITEVNGSAGQNENTETDATERATPDAGQSNTPAADDAAALRAERDALRDQLLRRVAEFENFKRRTREEKDVLIKYGNEGLLLGLLPVLDDFERSLDAGKTHPDFTSFFAGVEIIYGKLLRTLEQRGLTAMDAKGKPFDVDFHDALLQVPTSDAEPGTVLDVAEKGYLLHDKVIRHAKVTVAIEPPDTGAGEQA
ncbi:MAG: nucleotide exchange factor GrpE [Bacteroidia bacterium]|nr:nucleotide exchange factor GrpE [Bacteroidia bacterium]